MFSPVTRSNEQLAVFRLAFFGLLAIDLVTEWLAMAGQHAGRTVGVAALGIIDWLPAAGPVSMAVVAIFTAVASSLLAVGDRLSGARDAPAALGTGSTGRSDGLSRRPCGGISGGQRWFSSSCGRGGRGRIGPCFPDGRWRCGGEPWRGLGRIGRRCGSHSVARTGRCA
ncbi:MAG: hypothetical protein ACI9OJ_004004 [Myxococcota bacterium]|jgi:hypothetical protein